MHSAIQLTLSHQTWLMYLEVFETGEGLKVFNRITIDICIQVEIVCPMHLKLDQ